MTQDLKTVLIREPGNRAYNPAASISESAKELWEYAVLSENAYIGWLERAQSSRASIEHHVFTKR